MAEVDTASVAETTPSPEATPSPSVDTFWDDDSSQTTSAPAEPPSQETETVEAKEADVETKPPVEEKTEQAKEEEFDGDEPEDLKRAFKTHPELRQAHFGYQAYKEVFPSIQEARQIKSMFPSLDVANQAQSDALLLHQVDALFTNEPEAFIRHAYEGSREALLKMVEALPNVLFNLDPDAYTKTLGERPVRAVFGNLLNEAREALLENAENTEAQDLKTAIEILQKRLFGDKAKAEPQRARRDENDPVYREWMQYKERDARFGQERYQQFTAAVGQGIKSELTKTIDEAVGRLNTKGMSERALKTAKEEILQAVQGHMRSMPYVNQLVKSQLRSGTDQAAIVQFVMGHASPIIPSKVKEVIGEWTGEILSTNKAQLDKARDVPKRPDVGSAGGTPSVQAEKIDYRNPKHTDDFILGLSK